MNQESQNSKLNNFFTYDLYDNVGRAKRVLQNIIESFEERKEEEKEEESITDSIILYEITIEEIASDILDITYHRDPSDRKYHEQIENIKSELEYSINSRVPYETTPLRSIEYMAYDDAMSEIIDLHLNNKDITKSEHYNNVLDFLVKKIYIRGF
ncbi:hypothetical protein [Romboutsia sp.]|uniref:hypothetical protein n=1 Tax=Romboutsia sp. TaxID=1965302 RepID=UPI003F3488FD